MAGLRGILKDPLLSVVMPVYNERATIEEIIGRVLAQPVRVELIVVDDGSTDGTRDILTRLQQQHGFRLIFQERNQGKGAALRRGFAEVTGDIVVIQDADLEYSPEEYPELIELICQGRADVVYGSRFIGRHRVFLFSHYLGNVFLTFLTNVLYNTMLTDMETCYKVMRVEVLRSMTLEVRQLRDRARADGEDLQARLPGVRGADHLRRPELRRRQEDYVARRRRRAVGAAEVPLHRVNALLRLLRYAAPYRLRLIWAIAAMLVYAAASALLPLQIKVILDSVLPRQEQVGQAALIVVLAYLFKGLGGYFSNYLMADVGQRVVRDLRNRLHSHMLEQSAGFFARRSTGQLLSRITNDVGQVQHVVAETIGDLLQEGLALIGYAGLLFWYDARLALVCVTGAPIIVYPLAKLGRRLRRTTRRSQEALEHLSHVAAESFAGHRIVKAFGAERREAARFSAASSQLYRTSMTVTSIVSILPPLMELLGGFAIAGALYYGSREIAAGRLTTGEFAAFIAALLLMYGPVKKLSRVNASLQQAIAAAERVFEVLDRHTEVVEKPGAAGAGAISAHAGVRGRRLRLRRRPRADPSCAG